MELIHGQVVEFLENQKYVCASVIEKKGARYRLLTHTGREVILSPARFLHVSPPLISSNERQGIVDALKKCHDYRDKLSREIDIKELWEVIHEDAEVCSPNDLAGLVFGMAPEPDHEAACVRAVINDHTNFKYRNGSINNLRPEIVEKLLVQREKEAEQKRLLQAGCLWVRRVWSGVKSVDESGVLDQDIIAYWINAIRDYCVKGDESKYYVQVKHLFRAVGIKGGNVPFETMVKAGVWSRDENLEILRYGVETVFPDDCIRQAEELASAKPDLDAEEREDLRHLEAVTIDGPASRDMYDAISFRKVKEGYEIGVHITDIGLELKPGSPLFEDAISRATSIYLPDMQVSMLPESLSHNAWSLFPGKDHRAVSFILTVTPDGSVVNSRITRSIINVKRRLSYADADREIEDGGALKHLHDLCLVFQKKRIEAGALPLPIPALDISVSSDGSVEVRLLSQGPARFMVSECMIMANAIAARFLHNNQIPALYRSQPEPRKRIVQGNEDSLLANYRQRRLLSRGQLGPDAEPHSGLGLDVYTTITSPLRRGLDLLMQQQITSVLKSGLPLHNEKDIARYAILLKEGLATAASVRAGTVRYWLLRYFEGVKGKPLKGWVLETGPGRPIVVLADTLNAFELPVPKGFEVKSNQEVTVQVTRVSARENILRLDWYDMAGSG
jgi:exoribonuclease-2